MADVMARMKSRVAGRGARIALPEADDERMILAAKTIVAEDLARVVLVGKPDVIRALAARHGLALDDVEIVDVEDDEVRRRCADLYYERRKDRGVTAEEAWEVMADPLFAAAAMVSRAMSMEWWQARSFDPSGAARLAALHRGRA